MIVTARSYGRTTEAERSATYHTTTPRKEMTMPTSGSITGNISPAQKRILDSMIGADQKPRIWRSGSEWDHSIWNCSHCRNSSSEVYYGKTPASAYVIWKWLAAKPDTNLDSDAGARRGLASLTTRELDRSALPGQSSAPIGE